MQTIGAALITTLLLGAGAAAVQQTEVVKPIAPLPSEVGGLDLSVTRGYPYRRCVVGLRLYSEQSASLSLECEGTPEPRVHRIENLNPTEFQTYRALVLQADLFGGGYVAEHGNVMCADCGSVELSASIMGKAAKLLVNNNPTFKSGARAQLVEMLQAFRERVDREELAKRQK